MHHLTVQSALGEQLDELFVKENMTKIAAIPVNAGGADALRNDCSGCDNASELDFEFEYAYQPIVQFASRSVFAHEALVRGPNGESAASILARVNMGNQYRFDQECRMKAVAGAAALGMQELLSINFLPNAVYRPEICIQSTF